MLNEEKIRLMTRLSIYEERKGKQTFPVGKYHKKDYVVLKMFQTAVAVAIAYIFILGIWTLANLAVILEDLNRMNFVVFGIKLLIGFALLETVFAFAAFAIYSRKYVKAAKSLKGYYNNLKRLDNFY